MSKENKFTTIVTPKGTAIYPCLRSTETFQGTDTGKYSIQLKLSEEDTKELMDTLEKEWEAASKSPDFKDKKFKKGTVPNLSYREDKDGDIVFKAKTNATIKSKTGEVFQKTVPIFDAKGKPIKGDIGHGSVVKLNVSLTPYAVSAVNYGIAMYLNGVQVLSMKHKGDYGADASSLGFGAEEGYSVDEDEDMNDVPFDTEEPTTADEESDF